MIDVDYRRDWQVGLKENFQDSVVKPIILTTQKVVSVKDFMINVSKIAVSCGYVHIY